MMKAFRLQWIFFAFTLIFSVFLFRSMEEGVLCGVLYAALLGVKLPHDLRPRDLFPLVMLFLFLMVITLIPQRLFTASLMYTVRSLILFRALVATLNGIQGSKRATPKAAIAWIAGLTLSLGASALLVYSTFRPVGEPLVHFAHYFVFAPLMVLGTLFTPLAVPGAILGLSSLFPLVQWESIVLFAVMEIVDSFLRPRTSMPE
ncbi:MAG: hypothetical protein H7333_12515 [Bdellovibrionales bacterium]|nr:hypothetical protein [Oligoflexia bacterium]